MIAQTNPPFETEVTAAGEERGSRHRALAAAVAGLRVRRGRLAVDQILLAAAAILFPLGLVFIILGWEGAAHNGHTYAQIDYLISGGIFGLGLSVAGGFMYFGYWLSRQLSESRRQNALTVQALQRLEDLLDFAVNARTAEEAIPTGGAGSRGAGSRGAGSRGAGGRGAGGSDGSGGARAAGSGGVPAAQAALSEGGALFATPKGNLLHRGECPVVARRRDLKTVQPGTQGYRFCSMCNAGVPA